MAAPKIVGSILDDAISPPRAFRSRSSERTMEARCRRRRPRGSPNIYKCGTSLALRGLFLLLIVVMVLQTAEAQEDPFEEQHNAELAQWPANVHRCIHTTNKVRKRGDGSVVGSCSSCDPAQPDCDTGCQELIDRMYWACTDVCLPDGYYFDPNKMLSGCWEDNVAEMDINVERCGCNSGSRSFSISFMALTVIMGTALFFTTLM